ncbi:MAG: FAD-dependent oxidoreductase [Thiobacillaceae bacterium]
MNVEAFFIGAGVVGLSAALALSDRGVRVTIGDRGQQEGMSTWAGAGILSPLSPWAYPEEVNQLAMAGMAAWPELAISLERRARTSAEYWVCGMEVRRENDTRQALLWCQAHHFPVELDGDNVWLPSVAQARNPRLLAALKEAIVAQGGRLVPDCEVTGLNVEHRLVRSVCTTQGDFSADLFVMATGAWSALPMGNLPAISRVRPIRGQILLYPPGSHRLDHVVLQQGFYLVPRRDGHLLAGSTLEDAGFDAHTRPDVLDTLKKAACELLPALKKHDPIRGWAGLRPGSPDNIPLIDRHPDFDNLWLSLGHYRYGVTMAPASALLLADLIEGNRPALDPSPYSWPAFNKRAWTAENSPAPARC